MKTRSQKYINHRILCNLKLNGQCYRLFQTYALLSVILSKQKITSVEKWADFSPHQFPYNISGRQVSTVSTVYTNMNVFFFESPYTISSKYMSGNSMFIILNLVLCRFLCLCTNAILRVIQRIKYARSIIGQVNIFQ